jgi:1,4-alpha-glucan branching enzyme
MIVKEQGLAGKLRITFSMPAGIWADTIHLVGDFNDWNKTATPLRLNDHNWSVSLDLDADQCYQYRYLINGTDWYNDWRADDYRPNELGGDNSVVMTTVNHDALRTDPLQMWPIHGRPGNVLSMRQRTNDEAAVALQKETA